MNTSSICRNFDDLQTLLAKINVKFNVIGITETRLNKYSIRNPNIDLSGYSFEHAPTEANWGGALLYIDNISVILYEMTFVSIEAKNWNLFLLKL